jgi:hypothetical protein
LVDAFVLTAGGVSVDDTLAAVDSGKRPEPVTRLLDDSGFPVFAAEVAELDVAAMIEHFSDAAEPLRRLSSSEQAMRGFPAGSCYRGESRQAAEHSRAGRSRYDCMLFGSCRRGGVLSILPP